MTNPTDSEELSLPDDLKALDEELSSIRYEERPSFGPELHAELASTWARGLTKRPAIRPYLAAAAIAGLLLAGVAVPSARALVNIFGVFDAPEEAVAPSPVPQLMAMPAPVAEVAAPPAPAPEPLETPAEPIEVAEVAVETEAPIPPRMLDRDRAQALLQDVYPSRLQEDGVGGVVWLRVWVDATGRPEHPAVSRRSGVRELDVAALQVAPLLRFEPALQNGRAVPTWIEFPVLFEPDEDAAADPPTLAPIDHDPLRLPVVHPDDQWEYDQPLDLGTLPEWHEPSPADLTGPEAALVDAIGDPIVRRSLGPIESILSGVAPEGRPPTEWRASATTVLEDALERAPTNPAPLLALGRIRLRQGLRTDARMLFEKGLQIGIGEGAVSYPEVVAELHYERGRLIRDAWLASAGVGRVEASAFEVGTCSQARSSGRAASGWASTERLIAWNYLCPSEARRVFDAGFEARNDGLAELSLTIGSFGAALELVPGQVAANVGLLMQLAAARRWEDVLSGARRFARHSDGHPHALLLAGLALQRLDRTEEAAAYFDEALERLPTSEVDEIRDVSYVIDADEVAQYRRLWGDERRAWEAAYWRTRDRTPSTAVNEREVEHLARTTYALLRFGGVASDPGEVWVRFGGPNDVHIVDEGAGKLTEFWDYGSGPDITFVRWVASQTMDLTPEGRAYVDDLGKIFPPQ